MSTNLIASLRQQLPSIYGEHLPDEIRYRRADCLLYTSDAADE